MQIVDFTTFCHAIRHLGALHAFSVTSWGRTEKRNTLVKGHPASRHMDWLAVDVVLDHPEEHHGLMEDAMALSLKALNEGDHIHIQVK